MPWGRISRVGQDVEQLLWTGLQGGCGQPASVSNKPACLKGCTPHRADEFERSHDAPAQPAKPAQPAHSSECLASSTHTGASASMQMPGQLLACFQAARHLGHARTAQHADSLVAIMQPARRTRPQERQDCEPRELYPCTRESLAAANLSRRVGMSLNLGLAVWK